MDNQNDESMNWMDEVLSQLRSEEGEPEPQKEDEVITLNEDDVESGEMFLRQQQYEDSLNRYPPDHPKRLFQHNFLRTGYLPVLTIKAKKTKRYTMQEVAEELKILAYYETKTGTPRLDQVKFCKIWHSRFEYVYAGMILTPYGMIDPETFKSEIVKMLFEMETERVNMDTLAEHIYKTYISAYKMDAYNEPNKIPFKNGDLVLNDDKKGFTFYDGCLSPVPYRFDYNFKNIPNCLEPKFPHFKNWMEGLFDEEDQYSLKQMLGYLLVPSNDSQMAFFIIGKGKSGKSILTDCIIPNMLGDASFPMSIGRFFDNNFQTSCSEGKLCMFDDDIGSTTLSKDDAGRFKNFVSARTIQIEHKHCNPVKINNSARIVCSGNHMINSDDKTDGFTRRLHTIYVKPRVIENVDRFFDRKIEKEIPMIVLWALEGLLEMYSNGGAPYVSERTAAGLEYYAESQKWEEQFINDCFFYEEGSVAYSQDIRDALNDWISENSDICGEGPLPTKFKAVTRWLQDEGADKNGFIYKRGIKRGDKYNARGYVNMAFRNQKAKPTMFTDEKGNTKIRVHGRKKGLAEEG